MTEPLSPERLAHIRTRLDAEDRTAIEITNFAVEVLAELDLLRTELARPAIEAERRRIRDVLDTSAAEARADGCFEGEVDIALKLREYEAKWAAEDAGRAE